MTERKLAMDVEDSAEWTGIGCNTLRQLIAWEKIPTIRVGNKILIRTEDLEVFLEKNLGRNLRDREDVIGVIF